MRTYVLAVALMLTAAAPVAAQDASPSPELVDYYVMLGQGAVDVCDDVVLQLQTMTGLGTTDTSLEAIELLDTVRSACFTTLNNLAESYIDAMP